jgi:glycosyltransferase involved in cell wall biosynthesis
MRIAYVVGAYPSRSETFIAREIEALDGRGVRVEVFPLWQGHEVAAAPAPAHPVHTCSRLAIRAQCRHLIANARWQCILLAGLFREGGAALQALWNLGPAFDMADQMRDLGVGRVHAHFGSAPSTVAWVAASVAGLPFSFSVHARDMFAEAQFFAAKARAADRIVACNSAAAERASELADPADRPKIALVPHGLPLDAYPFRSEPPAGEPLVLGVGRLVEKKGFVFLVRAVAQLRRRVPEVRCWLVGDGPEREALSREIAALGLGDAVELKGWLSHDEVGAAYERASALVVPSVVARDGDIDGLPNVVVEAAAMGVPIVATSVGGIGDLVRHGETGLVARPGESEELGEKITTALTDPEGAMARARRAREEVEARFDQQRTTAQLLQALGLPSP